MATLASAQDSSPDLVVKAISRGIENGRYAPGQRLVEADLTRELGVSRGPVREALKRLAGEGVVSITRHRGAWVRTRSRREVDDTFRVLEVLTGLAARLAAENIDAAEPHRGWLASAASALERFRDQEESRPLFQARRHFWDVILRIGGNGEVARLMPQIQITLLRVQFQTFVTPRQFDRQFREYQEIADAVAAGDPARAEKATRLHLRRRRESMASLPDEAFGWAENAAP